MRGVLQTETAECGIACLATIAQAHGRKESLAELRRRFPVSLSGTRLSDLIRCADAMGFSARPVRCELDELDRLHCPAILHWDLDHYVVLTSASGRHAKLFDPARGERRLALADVSKHFTGVALELTPAPSFEKKAIAERVRLSDLWGRLEGFKPFLAQLLALTFFLQIIGLISPLVSQIIVDDVIGGADRDLLLAVALGFGLLACFQISIESIRGLIQLHAGQRLSVQLSGNLLRHLLQLPTAFFERRHVGDVLSRFGSLGPPQTFLTGGMVGIVLDAVLVVPVAVIMVLYSPLLSIIAVLNLVVLFGVRAATFSTVRRYAEENLNLGARSDTVFLETVRAVRAIKIAGREAERHSAWQNTVVEQQNVAYRQGRFSLFVGSGLGLWQALSGLALLVAGALQVIDGQLTLGMLFAFQAYAMQFSSRISGLIAAFFQFRMLGLHLERLADIVHTDPEAGGTGPASLTTPVGGRITAEAIRFRYGDFDPWVLNGVNLDIAAGEFIAIVGPSGGGKSTLLKILMGLYAPTEGRILFDGARMTQTDMKAMRQRIGVVMQDDQLLSGSISDNVAFFDAHLDQSRVEEVCRVAQIHDEITRMPMGYDSLVGDMGSILSGGQKQRLLLARALYRNPRILFMDEGTANLDPTLERRVMAALQSLCITRVMVAHRETAIAGADRVVRIEDGVVQSLPHGAGAAPPPLAEAVT